MRLEIVLFIIAGILIANIYYDGKVFKTLISWKKYYQMCAIGIGALVIYWLFKNNPSNVKSILTTSNEYIKYLPVDKTTSSIINPILDFTSKHTYTGEPQEINNPNIAIMERRLLNSGKKATKRSVSETKKKFVAARQNWKCEKCKKQLPAWFEVDHKIRLEYGGSNHIDNLVALCRDCHGEKTSIENL